MSVHTISLIVGILGLVIGVIAGLSAGEGNNNSRGFAIWITLIGVGFTIAGLVLWYNQH